MKTKKILQIIGIVLAIIVIILLIAFIAYKIGKIDMHNEIVDCANTCMNHQNGNIIGDCFRTCVWQETHDIGFAKIG